MNVELMLFTVSIWLLPMLLAITLHEAAHGWVAWRLGDDTAYRQGRVTFNPLKHIDLFGTILLPAMMLLASGGRFAFGTAKPVPVDTSRLRNPRRDMIIVAAAGPVTNILMALIAALLMHVSAMMPGPLEEWVGLNLRNAVLINLWLAVFNLIPMPPLDGGRIAVGLLPPSLAEPLARTERYGILILLLVIFVVPWVSATMGYTISPLTWLFTGPFAFLMNLVLTAAGWG